MFHPTPDEIFLERYRIKEQRLDSFAEQQAKLARETVDRLNILGEELFQVFQGLSLYCLLFKYSKAFQLTLSYPGSTGHMAGEGLCNHHSNCDS